MIDKLNTIKQAVDLLPDTGTEGWWCPECQDSIDLATSNECCPNCGTYLTDCQPTDKTGQAKKEALALLEEVIATLNS